MTEETIESLARLDALLARIKERHANPSPEVIEAGRHFILRKLIHDPKTGEGAMNAVHFIYQELSRLHTSGMTAPTSDSKTTLLHCADKLHKIAETLQNTVWSIK